MAAPGLPKSTWGDQTQRPREPKLSVGNRAAATGSPRKPGCSASSFVALGLLVEHATRLTTPEHRQLPLEGLALRTQGDL
eukprot:15763782-Heterocapsa_arctica.AAC.1